MLDTQSVFCYSSAAKLHHQLFTPQSQWLSKLKNLSKIYLKCISLQPSSNDKSPRTVVELNQKITDQEKEKAKLRELVVQDISSCLSINHQTIFLITLGCNYCIMYSRRMILTNFFVLGVLFIDVPELLQTMKEIINLAAPPKKSSLRPTTPPLPPQG